LAPAAPPPATTPAQAPAAPWIATLVPIIDRYNRIAGQQYTTTDWITYLKGAGNADLLAEAASDKDDNTLIQIMTRLTQLKQNGQSAQSYISNL
jgi:hypothetical protein